MNIVLNSNRSCASTFLCTENKKESLSLLSLYIYIRWATATVVIINKHSTIFPPFARETFSYSCWFSAVFFYRAFLLCVFFLSLLLMRFFSLCHRRNFSFLSLFIWNYVVLMLWFLLDYKLSLGACVWIAKRKCKK